MVRRDRQSLQKRAQQLLPFVSQCSFPDDKQAVIATPANTRATTWPLGKVAFSLLPLAGSYSRRATTMETPVEGRIWTFDQIQGACVQRQLGRRTLHWTL